MHYKNVTIGDNVFIKEYISYVGDTTVIIIVIIL